MQYSWVDIEVSFFSKHFIESVHMSFALGGGGMPTDSPTFKISMREYEDMAIKVGDKITIEIKKSDSSSGR